MSYEGYVEYLCDKGHYISIDCWSDTPKECGFCHSKISWVHDVDQTNGTEDDNPNTFPAELNVTGFDEVSNVDHRGNTYFTKIYRYVPVDPSIWRLVNI